MVFKDYGIVEAKFEGDLLCVKNAQDVTPTLQEVQDLRLNTKDNGFSDDRTMRHIARIPDIYWVKHPEWLHDTRLILKWLQTPEGSRYVINKPNTGRSGHVRVK